MTPCSLPDHTIDVWSAWLTQPPWPYPVLESVLSFAERRKAARYERRTQRREAVASRGLLRMLLAAYLRCAPETVPLRLGESGKPRLDPDARADLELSVTHTEGLVLYAIARCPVGIDVAYGRPTFRPGAAAAWWMSDCECERLAALPREDRCLAAGWIWTGKEAAFKAIGRREVRARDIEVFLEADGSCQARVGGAESTPPTWRLARLQPVSGYIATVCYPAALACKVRQQPFQSEGVCQ